MCKLPLNLTVTPRRPLTRLHLAKSSRGCFWGFFVLFFFVLVGTLAVAFCVNLTMCVYGSEPQLGRVPGRLGLADRVSTKSRQSHKRLVTARVTSATGKSRHFLSQKTKNKTVTLFPNTSTPRFFQTLNPNTHNIYRGREST